MSINKNTKNIIAEKLRKSDERDYTLFKRIDGVKLVHGYHFGFKTRRSTSKRRNNKILHIPYIDTMKTYTFRVTNRTHHLPSCRVGNIATVITAKGKRDLVITGYQTVAKTDDVIAKYKPVINFQDRNLGNYQSPFAWLYRHYVANKK